MNEDLVLGGHPKTGHRGSLQNRPTTNTSQDVDFDARASSLGRREQCLERRKEAASHRTGAAGMAGLQKERVFRAPAMKHPGRRLTGCRYGYIVNPMENRTDPGLSAGPPPTTGTGEGDRREAAGEVRNRGGVRCRRSGAQTGGGGPSGCRSRCRQDRKKELDFPRLPSGAGRRGLEPGFARASSKKGETTRHRCTFRMDHAPARIQKIPGRRFPRHAESIGPMGSPNHLDLGAECRLPLVGIRAPVKGRDGRSAPCSSSAMSSDRLFLDRVARQHCPSPLHRRDQTTMHPRPALAKPDISTLRRIGHFYFALTAGNQSMHHIMPPRVGFRRGWFRFTMGAPAPRVRS